MTRRGLHTWDRMILIIQIAAAAGSLWIAFHLFRSQPDVSAMLVAVPVLFCVTYFVKRNAIAEELKSVSARTGAFCNTATGLVRLSDVFFKRLTLHSEADQNVATALEVSLEASQKMGTMQIDLLQKLSEMEKLIEHICESAHRTTADPLQRRWDAGAPVRLSVLTSPSETKARQPARGSLWIDELSQVRQDVFEIVQNLQQTTEGLQETHFQLNAAARRNTRRSANMISEASRIVSKAEQTAAIFREMDFVLRDIVERSHLPHRMRRLHQQHIPPTTHISSGMMTSDQAANSEFVEIR